jgi:hypothetical protein
VPRPKKNNRKKKPKKKSNVVESSDDENAMVIDSDDQVKAQKSKKVDLGGMVDTDIEVIPGKEETAEEELGQF